MTTSASSVALEPTGGFTEVDGEAYYRIASYHRLRPFLMSIASDADLWMFVSSAGGLTAGRRDPDGSLFPYETVDKLHDGHHHTGPITFVRVPTPAGTAQLWQPFSQASGERPRVERNLYKNVLGNRLIFEEIDADLQLAFRYRWSACDEFGLVRTATLESRRHEPLAVELLDGLRNVLPYGAPLALHQHSSSLIDAYKRTDCDPQARLAIYSLTTRIVDRAEAAEELRANSVWCQGLPGCAVALSGAAIGAFRRGDPVVPGTVLTGQRGNFLVTGRVELPPGARVRWHLVADVGRSHVQLAALQARLRGQEDLDHAIETALREAGENLLRNIGSADGLQRTAHREAAAHHCASVLFNNMRGGVAAHNYQAPVADVVDFLRMRNRTVARRREALLAELPGEVPLSELLATAARSGDADFERLCFEYLPITFGRRHGDPSRPWNRFAIKIKNPDGSRALSYEGNWRDIFQNWEALCFSFPGLLPSVIAKFVNASTVDGFNPYRVTREGIDWEVVDPHDPWSNIGYWGDHQIVYLLRLLQALQRFAPGTLADLLEREIFCYADVPYRLKPYAEILRDPRATIVYDHGHAARIAQRVDRVGTDGKLLSTAEGSVYHVSLFEKLLVPALSKLSNLVADGGIWMNTQRPEWNDANNALVGSGVSVVTLCHLRRYLHFLQGLLDGDGRPAGRESGGTRSARAAAVSSEVAAWLERLRAILERTAPHDGAVPDNDRQRQRLLDALGDAFAEYREQVYAHGFSGKRPLSMSTVAGLCRAALAHIDHAIAANRREDGLYHAYNLLQPAADGQAMAVGHLYPMLEGQVAALSSGCVGPAEAVTLLRSLFASSLFQQRSGSFLLYPERALPGFMERNALPADRVRSIPLLRALLEAGDDCIVARDAQGTFRFQADFGNAADLAAALDRLAARAPFRDAVARDRRAVLELFEAVFDHRSFTGRSGAMYGYEGLGCIYWHMVSKLLLAVQEIALGAVPPQASAAVRNALVQDYYRIRAGLGFERSVRAYGAFPTDPYSHTPPHGGAQQPGMTGQVKESILARFGELGVQVQDGTVAFRPWLLRAREFFDNRTAFRYFDVAGAPHVLELPAGTLAFTFCQVPIVYHRSDGEPWIRVTAAGGAESSRPGDQLDGVQSRALFERCGSVTRVDVGVPERSLCRV